MASLRKRCKKGEWYALYRDAEGKLKQLPTNTTDRKPVQQLADEWEAAAKPTKAMRTVEAMRRAMAETYKKLHGSEMHRMSVAEFGKVWLEIRKGEVTIASHLAYKRVVDSFMTFLNERATDDMFLLAVKTSNGSAMHLRVKSVPRPQTIISAFCACGLNRRDLMAGSLKMWRNL